MAPADRLGNGGGTTGAEASSSAAGPSDIASSSLLALPAQKDAAAPKVPPWASLASGAASGAASCLLLQPMDLLKTRLQQQQQGHRQDEHEQRQRQQSEVSIKGKQKDVRGGPAKRTARLVGVARQVVRDDGWVGLWRGTVPSVARNVPGVALYFYSVSEIRALLSRSEVPLLSLQQDRGGTTTSAKDTDKKQGTLARLTVAGNLASGAVARVAVGFVLSPVTIVKARFESSNFSKQDYPTLTRALVEIYQRNGVPGLFRGFVATALRDAPYAGLYLAIYEKTKDGLARTRIDQERGSSAVVSASGVIAGTLATFLTHPFDILKTRIQTMPEEVLAKAKGGGVAGPSRPPKQPSLLSITRLILKNEGAGAFLDGLGLRCARKAFSSAIGWTIFEGGRGLWVRSFEARQERERSLGSSIVSEVVDAR